MPKTTRTADPYPVINASKLRRNLAVHLQRAAGGQTVAINYKGKILRLVVDRPIDKIEALLTREPRPNPIMTGIDLARSSSEIQEAWYPEWQRSWDRNLRG